MKNVVFLIIFCFSLLIASELHVGVGQDYSIINDAIQAAADGDTVTVHDGTYPGRVIVNKEIYLRSVNGAEYTFVHPDTVWTAGIDIYAANVVVEGFSVYGATSGAGIAVNGTSFVEIRNNRAGWDSSHRNRNGIQFFSLGGVQNTNIKIIGNTCSYNTEGGIYVNSHDHLIEGNTCEYNQSSTYDGIFGIGLYATWDCTVKDNICRYNDVGIKYYYNSSYDTIVNNQLTNNTEYGLWAHHQQNMMYSGNEMIDNNGPGLRLSGITFCTFWSNRISGNTQGVYIRDSQYVNFHLNSFFDDDKFEIVNGSEFKFMTPVKLCYAYGVNTYKSVMGNFYDDFTGPDDNGDGLGDDTYYYQIGGEYNDTKALIATRENYNLQVWFLNNEKMFRNNEKQEGTFSEIGANGDSYVWIADGPTIDGISYPAGVSADFTTWTGAISGVVVPTSPNSYDFTLEMGYSDGTNFTAGGPVANVAYTTWQHPITFHSTESAFFIPGGNYLALKATINSIYDHGFRGGGGWAYISAPIGSPEYVDYENGLEAPQVTITYVSTEEFTYVELEWNAITGAASYNVYSCDTPDGTFNLEHSGTGIADTIWLDFIGTEEMKFYKVTAID
jgi:parallel beta-helix repeat protein